MMRRNYLASAISLGFTATVLLGCEQQPAKIVVAGGAQALAFHNPHQTQKIDIAVFDADNQIIKSPVLTWSSLLPRVAEVSEDGVVVPRDDGRTRIAVQSGYIEAEVPVTVQIYTTLQVSPEKLHLDVGDVMPMTARVLDRAGDRISGARIAWRVADPQIIELDETTVSVLEPGKTALMVEAAGLMVEVPVEVRAPIEDAS